MTRHVFTPLHDLRAVLRLVAVFRREGFTIVHAHNPKPGLLAPLAARFAGVPVIVRTLHGFYFDDRTPRIIRGAYASVERVAARLCNLVLSQSGEDVQTALRERIGPPSKIAYLGMGIDIQGLARGITSVGALDHKRRELGLPQGIPVVGFVGRLVREKGVLDLLAAARALRHRLPTVRYLIVGPVDWDKPDAVTPESARAYGVEDLVIFTGMRQDVRDLYALMDIFVLPSHREGFPRTPMEAMAMGLPCIVTDIRGCREVVQDNRTGLLVPPADPDALARAITALVEDPKRARRMGDEGRRVAVERFDERQGFHRLIEAYERLLRENA